MLRHLMAALRVAVLAAPILGFGTARAQELQELKSMGVIIAPGNWLPSTHADKTFVEFKRLQGNLGQYDYYYQFRIYPHFHLTFANCKNSPDVDKYLQKYAGITQSGFLTVKATVRQRGAQGDTELVSDLPILITGRGIVDNAGAEGNGCFFDQALDNITPLIRYSGTDSSQETFNLKFQIARTTNVKSQFVARAKELFSAVNAAFSFTDLTGARATLFNTVATEMEQAFNDSSKVSNSNSLLVTMPIESGPGARVAITMPTVIDARAGYFAFYLKLSASQVLAPGVDVTPGNVLSNGYLGAKTCFPRVGAKLADCVPERKTFREFMASQINDMPIRFFDIHSPRWRKQVFETCTRMRVGTTETLGLATIDALLARWAAVKESGLYDLLTLAAATEPGKRKPLEILAAENERAPDELVAECWSADDQKKLAGVVEAVTGKPLK